jgi:hypothetical protein
MENEVWKKIPGFKNYKASSLGRIMSVDMLIDRKNRWGTRTKYIRKGRILKQSGPYKFCKYKCCSLGFGRRFFVHRLIALTFIENKKNKKEVNHINGNKLDNRVTNLEWTTTSENRLHAFENNLNRHSENHGNAILTNAQVVEIKRLLSLRKGKRCKPYMKDIGKKFGISREHVKDIATGHSWRRVVYEGGS